MHPCRWALFRVWVCQRISLETRDVVRVVEVVEMEVSGSVIDVLPSTGVCCYAIIVWRVVARVCAFAAMPWLHCVAYAVPWGAGSVLHIWRASEIVASFTILRTRVHKKVRSFHLSHRALIESWPCGYAWCDRSVNCKRTLWSSCVCGQMLVNVN